MLVALASLVPVNGIAIGGGRGGVSFANSNNLDNDNSLVGRKDNQLDLIAAGDSCAKPAVVGNNAMLIGRLTSNKLPDSVNTTGSSPRGLRVNGTALGVSGTGATASHNVALASATSVRMGDNAASLGNRVGNSNVLIGGKTNRLGVACKKTGA